MERNTRQREAIRKAIADEERPLLPSEILDQAQAHASGVSLATVYRSLKVMVEEGELQAVSLPGNNTRYELAGRQHHHHFQCTRCQRVFDIDACPGNLSKLLPQGFSIEDHDLTLYGSCALCSHASRTASAPKAAKRARSATC